MNNNNELPELRMRMYVQAEGRVNVEMLRLETDVSIHGLQRRRGLLKLGK